MMLVPLVVNKILWHVMVEGATPEQLLQHIKAINVFIIRRWEAQVRNTGPMSNAWWEDGHILLNKYVHRSLLQIINEANVFFNTGMVEVHQENMELMVCLDEYDQKT